MRIASKDFPHSGIGLSNLTMGKEDKKGNTIEFRSPEPSLYLYQLESGFYGEPDEKKQLLIPFFSLLAEVTMNLRTLIPESHTDDYLFVLQDSSPGIRDSLY